MGEITSNSILSDVKKYIGLNPDEVDEFFDSSIISGINTSISELAQLGLRNLGEFIVQDASATWDELLGEEYAYVYAFAKNYVEINTRMLFDPPQSGSLSTTLKDQLAKATFNVQTAIEHHNIESEEDKS